MGKYTELEEAICSALRSRDLDWRDLFYKVGSRGREPEAFQVALDNLTHRGTRVKIKFDPLWPLVATLVYHLEERRETPRLKRRGA